MIKKRTDTNQKHIVKAFLDLGATVQTLHTIGKGCPDLLVGFRGKNILVEVKTEEGDLNPRQRKFVATWQGGTPYVIRSIDEVAELLNKL